MKPLLALLATCVAAALFCASSAVIQCFNCRGAACETGGCNGSYCIDSYSYHEITGTRTYYRGCWSPIAGFAEDKLKNAKVGCEVSFLNQLKQSTCFCNTEKCNSGDYTVGNWTAGKLTCDRGDEESSGDHCEGSNCRYGQGELGIGCESSNGLMTRDPYAPPPGFNGCFKRHRHDGTDLQEQCVCSKDHCSSKPPKFEYKRKLIRCQETANFEPEVHTCEGNACYIVGVELPPGINGYQRGCIMVSGEGKKPKEIPVFCSDKYTGGSSKPVQSCLCATQFCNNDTALAIDSITKGAPKYPFSVAMSILMITCFILLK